MSTKEMSSSEISSSEILLQEKTSSQEKINELTKIRESIDLMIKDLKLQDLHLLYKENLSKFKEEMEKLSIVQRAKVLVKIPECEMYKDISDINCVMKFISDEEFPSRHIIYMSSFYNNLLNDKPLERLILPNMDKDCVFSHAIKSNRTDILSKTTKFPVTAIAWLFQEGAEEETIKSINLSDSLWDGFLASLLLTRECEMKTKYCKYGMMKWILKEKKILDNTKKMVKEMIPFDPKLEGLL